MAETLRFHYDVDGDNFTSAGVASVEVKRKLRQLGFDAETIRRVSIAMYEGEINMVVHARGGSADVYVDTDCITIILADSGPGIPDIDLAMQEGYSTAPDNIRALGFGAGMGLPNMKRYTDEMKIETVLKKGTTVTMKVYITGEKQSDKNTSESGK
ncbi:MAG: ATP-binding protein [Eubacteriales bacterium]|jgi:anti-sigma regulatory factor (Ser/Thr protein kinase)|nr:ATP-binding protein [Eubacteriales bacterium]